MLPEMTVEKRAGQSHGVVPPSEVGSPDFDEQLFDMHVLVRGYFDEGFSSAVQFVLRKYAVVDMPDIPQTMAKFGFNSWRECCDFVRDDLCVDFGREVLKYAQSEGLTSSFIHPNVVFFKRLMERMERTLEKCFDEKYHHKHPRPLTYLVEKYGDYAASMGVGMHPGHWSYVAGHKGKFAETAETAKDFWKEVISDAQCLEIDTADHVLSMGRSGLGYHYPRDNVASGAVACRKGYEAYKA